MGVILNMIIRTLFNYFNYLILYRYVHKNGFDNEAGVVACQEMYGDDYRPNYSVENIPCPADSYISINGLSCISGKHKSLKECITSPWNYIPSPGKVCVSIECNINIKNKIIIKIKIKNNFLTIFVFIYKKIF